MDIRLCVPNAFLSFARCKRTEDKITQYNQQECSVSYVNINYTPTQIGLSKICGKWVNINLYQYYVGTVEVRAQ